MSKYMHALRKIVTLGILSVMFLLFAMSTVIADPDKGHPGKGTGLVRIYLDQEHTNELTPSTQYDAKPHYLLAIGRGPYYFVITGITEFPEGTPLNIKIGYKDTSGPATAFIGPVNLLSDGSVAFEWTVPPNAMFCTTGTVHYYNKDVVKGEFIAQNPFAIIPSIFHVIPENYLGSIGALGAGALALVAFITIKRRAIKFK